MLIYAIIPARGGSKGIKDKNLSLVNGRSLIEIGVTNCISSTHVHRVFVTTDSARIADEAEILGAEVIERPDSISGDTASSESAILHTLDQMEKKGIEQPDAILFLQATSPFTVATDLDGACEHFIATDADSLFTGSLFVHFLWRRNQGGMEAINHEVNKRPRRQEISNCFAENGAFYIMKTDGFKKAKHRFFGKIEMYEMDDYKSHEIDEPMDLNIANVIAEKLS